MHSIKVSKQIWQRIMNSGEEKVLLVGIDERLILDCLVYIEGNEEFYKGCLPSGMKFIGAVSNEENSDFFKPIIDSKYISQQKVNKSVFIFTQSDKFEIIVEQDDAFIKNFNYILLISEFPSNVGSQFFCKLENLDSQFFFSSELEEYKQEKAEKSKKKGAKKPILKDNPLKDFQKSLKSQAKLSLEESKNLNKSLNFPLQKLLLYSNQPTIERSPVIKEGANGLANNIMVRMISLDDGLEESVVEMMNEIKDYSGDSNERRVFYNEFNSIPLLCSSSEIELAKKLTGTSLNWPGKFPPLQKTFEGKPINVHKGLNLPSNPTEITTIKGSYAYFHYLQDGFNDEGWGCAYRSLQTLLSWYSINGISEFIFPRQIKKIQEIVATMGDQGADFIGSSTWIGSMEVGYVVTELTGYEHRIIFLQNGADIQTIERQLSEHIKETGSPIMFGGADYAYTLLGISAHSTEESRYLILDPHYTGTDEGRSMYEKKGIAWRTSEIFKAGSYYNFCLPTLTKSN